MEYCHIHTGHMRFGTNAYVQADLVFTLFVKIIHLVSVKCILVSFPGFVSNERSFRNGMHIDLGVGYECKKCKLIIYASLLVYEVY